jgi:hypothetical protein
MTRILPWALLSIALACGPAQAQTPVDPAPAAETPAKSGKVGAPPEGKGQVVFFRQSSMAGMPYAFTIKDGDIPVTKLGNDRYFVYVADPGEHEFRVRGETKDTLFLEIEPGETYYVEQTMVMGMFYYANLAPSGEATFEGARNLKPGSAAR